MNIKKKQEIGSYNEYVKETMPKTHTFSSCIRAFLVGGLICTIGQGIRDFGENILKLDEAGVSAFTCIVLIFLGALLTGFGVYDVIGKFAGSGSIVPITGFANSMVSPALEYKREGYVLGVGAKLFTIAGPVLVYGISSSVLVGLVYFILNALGVIQL